MYGMMGNGIGYGMGYGYQPQPQQKPILNQMLEKKEIEHLRSKGARQFSFMISEDEALRAMCNHKDDNNNIALVGNSDGTVTCTICGERFTPLTDLDISSEAVEKICEDYNDVIQTSKTFLGNLPVDAGRQIYKTFALTKKVPAFWEAACDYMHKIGQSNNMIAQNGMGNVFGIYQNLTNSGMGMPQQMMYPQQQWGQPMPQPQPAYQYNQQPMQQQWGQPPMGQPMPQPQQPQMQMQPPQQPFAGMWGQPMPQPPMMGQDRPVGIVEPQMQSQQPAQPTNQVVQNTLTSGPNPVPTTQTVPVPTTGDVKKAFKA